jgi:hypothetical protein
MAKLSTHLSLGYSPDLFSANHGYGQLMIRRIIITMIQLPSTKHAITYKMPTGRIQESVTVFW